MMPQREFRKKCRESEGSQIAVALTYYDRRIGWLQREEETHITQVWSS